MKRFVARFFKLFFAGIVLGLTGTSYADETLLFDRNGDGSVQILAFGDSITFGIGGSVEGNGYPRELSDLVGVPVLNSGVPGERLLDAGIDRLPGTVSGSGADIVVLLEGVNDSFTVTSSSAVKRGYQRSVNVIRALGREAVLGTPLPTCCERAGLEPIVSGYADVARAVASQNGIPLIDFRRGWVNTCGGVEECELFSLPEGLHPNDDGYVVMAQTAAAALLGIDLFIPGGAEVLEGALGLIPGTVLVKPDPAA